MAGKFENPFEQVRLELIAHNFASLVVASRKDFRKEKWSFATNYTMSRTIDPFIVMQMHFLGLSGSTVVFLHLLDGDDDQQMERVYGDCAAASDISKRSGTSSCIRNGWRGRNPA